MPHKLLLADDSVTIQRVIELTFADEDIKVLAVGDGQQAVDHIESDPPDIVLADVGMPKRNGYEVASYVKSHPHLAHIPVLLLTGAFEPVDQARATAAGCDGVLAKPFEPLLVISRVKDLLGAREGAAARALIPIPATQMAGTATIGGARLPARQGHLSIDSMRPAAKTADVNVSLDDYFDQLDTAFSKLSGPRESTASAPDRPSSPVSADDFGWLQEAALRKPESKELSTASETLDFSGVTGIEADPRDSSPRREELETAQPVAQPHEGDLSTHDTSKAATSIPPASIPPIADRFAALLAAEQGELPGPPSAAPPTPDAAAAALPEGIVDQVATKVLKTLSDKVVRETVAQVVAQVAERLVREEIEKIKAGKS